MKKKIYYFFTILSLCCLIFTIYLRSNYYSFNSKNVKNNIEYLSSNKFKGRLTGSDSNNAVAKEIMKEFISYGLEPLDNSYLEKFTVNTPVFTGGECSIKIMDNGNIIKELKPGTDFKEDMLNFKSSSAEITKNDKISIFPKSILIEQGNKKYIFYVTFDKEFPFRSSFIYECPFEFAIEINTDTFNELLSSIRNGYTININLPYEVQKKTTCNVVGKIEGTNDSLSPLIITAHFDHVGVDSLGNVYSGALDNASGSAFLLELAHTFSTLKTPTRDIIFVALTGEEFGLLGSEYFANKYASQFKGATVINYDMVGIDDLPITFIDGKNNINTTSKLLSNLQSICIDNDFQYLTNNQDSSDHASFINNGYSSVTISHSDLSNIHTPRDTAEKISTNALDDIYTLSYEYIFEYAYSDTVYILYSKWTILFFTISTSALIIFYFIHVKKSS